MYTQQEDLAYPSAFGRFAFTRTYNSQSSYKGPLGLGWTQPFDFELTELPSGAIRMRNGAGNVRFYEVAEAGETTVTYRVGAPARDASTLLKHKGGFTESERDGLQREFSLDGRLQAITNRAGWTTTFSYSGGLLTTVTDPGGRTLRFTYDGSGRLIQVEGPGALFAEYSYDNQGRLVAVADALGTRWTYAYSDTSPSRLISVKDANGNLVEGHTYDGEGRVIATTGAEGAKAISLNYQDTSHTKVTDSLGRVTTYTFGVYGDFPLVTRVEGPCPCGSPDSTMEYDAGGRRVVQKDARGNTTRFEYDASGNLIKLTDALGQARIWSYNAFGQVLTSTDSMGATATFDYEPFNGVLLKLTDALGHATTSTLDAHNLPGAVTDPRGNTTIYSFDDTGLISATTDPTGAVTKFAYDAAGRLLNLTDAAGEPTRYSYDTRGRLLTVTDPVGAVTRFEYDATGNRVGLTNPNGERTNYVYDAANRLIQVTDSAGGKTTYSYDTENNLIGVTDARGNKTTFVYDAHNRLIRRTDPLGASEIFGYDPGGNLMTRTDRKEQTITYSYDGLNRLTAKALPDGSVVTYEYDPGGRLLRVVDANGPLSFEYDALGRLHTTRSQDGRTLTYGYDTAGNRIGLQDETGTLTTYSYDPRNLLTSLTNPRTGTFAFQYDPLGRRISLIRPNGTSTVYSYDAASRLIQLTHRGRWGPFEALAYSYDPAANRTGETRNWLTHQYRYDPLDQLTAVLRQSHRGRLHREEQYSYDAVGNRHTGPDQQAYQYDAANRLTQDRTYTYAYDASGNLIEKRHLRDGRLTSYSYDAEDRLIRVVTPWTEVIFAYDPLGRRTEKRVLRWHDEDDDQEPDPDEEGSPRVTRYLYDQEDILATFDETGREKARYTHGPGIDEPLATVQPQRNRYYHADMLGSIIALTGENGHPVRRYHYSAFGIPEDHRSDPQPYRFTGREWDNEIGLYYYRARYYAPGSGRFLSEDTFDLGQPNLYVYVGNGPATLIDPMGLFQFWRVVRGGLAVAVGSAIVLKGAVVAGGSGGMALPLGIYMTLSGTAIASAGVTDVLLGFTLSEETKVTLPAPTPEALATIAITGGNLETANKVNEAVDLVRTLNTLSNAGKGAELTQRELTLFFVGLGAKGGELWAEKITEARRTGSFRPDRTRCLMR
jgi:RHS repeat-associated protein